MKIKTRMRGKAWKAIGLLALACTAGAVQAASFGHARLASAPGEPLLVMVPVSDLGTADRQALSASPAPASDWELAGLKPPVSLDSLQISVLPDQISDQRLILQIRSSQALSGSLADLLLDVQTASGKLRYQVTLLASTPAQGVQQSPSAGSAATDRPAVGSAGAGSPAATITVRRGDTMFAIARRHGVEGVSVYQLMMALQKANPQAFIQGNINLVRAGASLLVPSLDDMLAVSDAEARRQFSEQAAAFARMRGKLAADARPVQEQAAAGTVSGPEQSGPASTAHGTGASDMLRLGTSEADGAADTKAAQARALEDAKIRVSQLEENVHNLNKALQSQGHAARDAVADGAQALGETLSQLADAIAEVASQEMGAGKSDGSDTAPATAPASSPDSAGDTAAGGAAAAGSAGAASPTAGSKGTSPDATAVAGTSGVTDATGGTESTAETSGAAATAGAAGTPGTNQASGAGGAGLQLQPLDPAGAGQQATPAEEKTADAAVSTSRQADPAVPASKSWLQENLMATIGGLLALLVLLIVWLLRRGASPSRADNPPITEAMVQERLQGINLDLQADDEQTRQS